MCACVSVCVCVCAIVGQFVFECGNVFVRVCKQCVGMWQCLMCRYVAVFVVCYAHVIVFCMCVCVCVCVGDQISYRYSRLVQHAPVPLQETFLCIICDREDKIYAFQRLPLESTVGMSVGEVLQLV